MQLKLHSLLYILRNRVAITSFGSLVCKLGQIVGLKLYSVYLVVSAQLLDLLLGILLWQRVLSVLVAGKLFKELLLSELLSPLIFCTKALWDREEGHDWVGIQTVCLYLV